MERPLQGDPDSYAGILCFLSGQTTEGDLSNNGVRALNLRSVKMMNNPDISSKIE